MNRSRLDSRDKMPSGMEEYLAQNGWHFNKKLCEWAISNMWKLDANGQKERISITPKEDIQKQFKNYGIVVDNCVGYDVSFVYHMAKSDYLGSSILDERCLLLYVKNYIDDPDGYDGLPMTRFYADCIGKGIPIMWEDMI